MSRENNKKWFFILIAVVVIAIVVFIYLLPKQNYVNIKYRNDPVDISSNNFKPLDKSDNTVKGAWYDSSNKYMVIKLKNVYYHYCGFDNYTWDGFKSSNSLYSYYEKRIRGKYDCRINPVPRY